jgi:hypothetical protein
MQTFIEPHKNTDGLAHAVIGAAIEMHRQLGLLINFNVPVLKNGIQRVVYTNNNSAAWRASRPGG